VRALSWFGGNAAPLAVHALVGGGGRRAMRNDALTRALRRASTRIKRRSRHLLAVS
jgi:hypothetical protein